MAKKKRALITGLTGQDGSYLLELLLSKGYEVHGLVRRCSSFSTGRIAHLIESPLFGKDFFYYWGDLGEAGNLSAIMQKVRPDEIYNLGAQSHVKVSFDVPEYTSNANALGAMRLLDAAYHYCPETRFYQASTSEMFGGIPEEMPEEGFDEQTPFHPRSPYGVSKLYAYWMTRNYREAYTMYACNGLLFNHESPRRGETFVSRKITRWFGENYDNLKAGEAPHTPLTLGNLNAIRDWGHAKDYVRAQWIILQQENPDDYVVATGLTHTVRTFVERCFRWCGLTLLWTGSGEEEVGYLEGSSIPVVNVHSRYFRPAEVPVLKGNASKMRALGWEPEYSLEDLVDDMMRHDCHQLSQKARVPY